MLKRVFASLSVVVCLVLASRGLALAGAVLDDPACVANQLPANDDGSTGVVPLGFPIRIGDLERSEVYVNNNGNVTLDGPRSQYTPVELSNLDVPIIAPFWADVDTRGVGSDIVRYGYGATVFNGRPALCVNWVNVGYYNSAADKTNSFQLLLVDRSDIADGAFDAVFNYDQVTWESGSASGGNERARGISLRAQVSRRAPTISGSRSSGPVSRACFSTARSAFPRARPARSPCATAR